MTLARTAATGLTCGAMLLAGCSTAKRDAAPAAIGTVAGAVLTAESVRALRPDAAADSAAPRTVALQLALAAASAPSAAGPDSSDKALASELSLRAGQEWGLQAAGSLLKAGRALKRIVDTASSAEAVQAAVDSLFGRMVTLNAGGGRGVLPAGGWPQVPRGRKPRDLYRLYLKSVLGVSDEVAAIVGDYTSADRAGTRRAGIEEMVKGLVFDGANKPAQPSVPEIGAQEVDNSERALAFRPQKSIQDSIQKHMAELKAIYKKSLKRNQSLAGVVYVEFRVNAQGRVIGARVSRTDVEEREFLDPLIACVRTIPFKPVPAAVGNMTFQFPFEFSPEE